jgi:hypothetical protein
MDKVKRLIDAGASISGAIREALSLNGLTVSAFADKYGRNRANMTSVIAGARAPSKADLKALVAELGGSDIEWRVILHEAGRPTAAVAS